MKIKRGDESMREITTLAIDLAKRVFQLHGVDARGVCVLRKQLQRAQLLSFLAQLPVCLVAMEACGGAHHWGRRIAALGHRVKLIAPQYVKPFVRGDKTDRNDAQGICEAALRPGMPEVAVKSEQQQAMLTVHRLRELIDKQRKQLANQLRSLLAEFGEVMACGIPTLRRELPQRLERVPELMRGVLQEGYERLVELQRQSQQHTRRIEQLAQDDPLCQRLMRERGIGPICASAYVASIGDQSRYRNGRQVSASLGIVPRKQGTGGKAVLLGISKRGDRYLRTLLIHGARAVIRHIAGKTDPLSCWLQRLIARSSVNCAAVALANKTARRLWAIWRAEQSPSLASV